MRLCSSAVLGEAAEFLRAWANPLILNRIVVEVALLVQGVDPVQNGLEMARGSASK